MSDAELPVFSFRPNWREPMTERLSFLTNVLTSSSGAEQRRSLRPTPRRTFEADFLLRSAERTFWDLFMNKAGGLEVTVPLYWEGVKLPEALAAGSGDTVAFDTRLCEWQYHAGRYALLVRDALTWELVQIETVTDTEVVFTAPVTKAWPKGTMLYPIRRATIEQASELTHKTAGVATATVQFAINGPTEWTPAADTSPVYSGLPVFTSEPNWVDDLAVEFARDLKQLDTGIGLRYQIDPLGRALIGQAHRWFLNGREALAGFRDLIYRHRGRAGSFWLPTFKHDLTLAANAGSTATQLQVKKAGLVYTGAPTSGREYVAIKQGTTTVYKKISSVGAGTLAANERITLTTTTGLALSTGLAPRISFMDTARFDSDDFEIVHHGGIDGLHTTSAMFRTFKNTRTAPTPIHDPIPAAVMGTEPCGTYPWYARFRVEWLSASVDRPRNGYILNPAVGATITYTNTNTAINHAFYEPFEYIEFVWVTSDIPPDQEVDLLLQFPSGTVDSDMRGRAKFKRFGDDDFVVLRPKDGSQTLADLNGWFDVRGLWPDNWQFDI